MDKIRTRSSRKVQKKSLKERVDHIIVSSTGGVLVGAGIASIAFPASSLMFGAGIGAASFAVADLIFGGNKPQED